jgi:uncharacterized delta-60 repeat protein
MCAARLAPLSLEALESRLLFAVGELDPTFAGGIVTRDLTTAGDFGFAVAVQADGKVLMAGRAWMGTTNGNDFAVARFNADGSIDSTFGNNGLVITNMGASSDTVYAIKVMSDGKIVVAGETTRSGMGTDFALARYNADGTLDGTFGSGGKVYTDFSNSTDQARSIALTGSGQIVVAGTVTIAGVPRVAMAVYTSAGTLDSTFGTSGKVTTTYAPGYARGESVAVLSNGSIVVGGSAFNAATGGSDFVAVKYLSTGILDSTFGTSGFAVVDFGYDETAHAIAVQTDGKIVLAGEYYNWDTDAADMAVTRINADGSLDATFGKVLTDFAGEYDAGLAAAMQTDGRIVVAGIATVGGVSRFGLARYNSDGTLDSTFNNGRVSFAIGVDAVGNCMAIDGAGQIVVAGFAGNAAGNYSFAAARVIGKVNAAPTANPGSGYSVTEGDSVGLDASGSFDPDGAIGSYEWDLDYDGVTFNTDTTGAAATFNAAGIDGPAVKTIALRVTDENGAASIATTSVTINDVPPPPEPEPEPEPDPTPDPEPGSVVLSDDPGNPGKKVLTFHGTGGSDRVRLRRARGGKLQLIAGGETLGTFDPSTLSQIVLRGGEGNDRFDLRNSPVPVVLIGGAGNDLMFGSKFGDVLIGGDGDDNLFGSRGNDLMIGGLGKDRMHSVFGEDLMVGGALSFEDNPGELTAARSAWEATRTASAELLAAVVDDKEKDLFRAASKKDLVIETPIEKPKPAKPEKKK